jgi:putative phosphotransacetylase
MKKVEIPIEISARHCHLSKQDLDKLFGAGHELKNIKQLGQPSDFACQETIDIATNSKVLKNLRIIGPLRSQTQIEISRTDAIFLGIDVPVRLSGNLQETPGIKMIGSGGEVELPEGLIVAQRHFHCSTEEAKKLKIKTGDIISVEVEGERPVIFKNIPVRAGDNYEMCLHLDTDEGNAAGINKTGKGYLIK